MQHEEVEVGENTFTSRMIPLPGLEPGSERERVLL